MPSRFSGTADAGVCTFNKKIKTTQKGANLGLHSLRGCRGITSRSVCEVRGVVSIAAKLSHPGPRKTISRDMRMQAGLWALGQRSLDPRGRLWRDPTRQGLSEGAPTGGFSTGEAIQTSGEEHSWERNTLMRSRPHRTCGPQFSDGAVTATWNPISNCQHQSSTSCCGGACVAVAPKRLQGDKCGRRQPAASVPQRRLPTGTRVVSRICPPLATRLGLAGHGERSGQVRGVQ